MKEINTPNNIFEPKQSGCLDVINNQRKTISEKLNEMCNDVMKLPSGNERKAENTFNKMLGMIDVGTMLDIITNEEREDFYEKIYHFFSGIGIEKFYLEELSLHQFQENSILDLMLIYKINIQERMNETLYMYNHIDEFEIHESEKENCISACDFMIDFAEMFAFLAEEELEKSRNIIELYKKGVTKNDEIIFVPKHFYEKIEN